MSKWMEHDIFQKLSVILGEARYDHHFGGRPYLTAYQVAIAFNSRHPNIVADLNVPIGGAGTGQQDSLSSYLAGMLSRGIKSGKITTIEGGFLANTHLRSIEFNGPSRPITFSLTATQYPLSMYRRNDTTEQAAS